MEIFVTPELGHGHEPSNHALRSRCWSLGGVVNAIKEGIQNDDIGGEIHLDACYPTLSPYTSYKIRLNDK